jgi:putative colanic acid biosynthesis UDP-glucose lipid carrier transferase
LGEKNNFSGIDTMVNGFFPSLSAEKETVAIPLGKMINTQLVNPEDEISINECIEYLNKHQVTDLYCTLSPETFPYLYQLAKQSEDRFVHFKFVADVNQMVKDGKWVESFNDLPLLSLRTQPLTLVSNAMQKRLFDMVFSTFIIIGLLSWLTPIIGIIIALESKGPIFFRQLRSGKNNKPFWCIKFRTLRMNKESDQIQVTKNDHRVTKFGRFLRKSNIDELPQFFNVLMGSMSVVGPRPHMLQHTTAFNALENDYMVRHFVQPGITGLAQINGFRGEIKHPDMLQKRLEKDIHYLENWSMADDLKIIWQTIVVSLKGDKNAY